MHSCEKKKTNKKTIILYNFITDPKFFNSSVFDIFAYKSVGIFSDWQEKK